MHVLEWELTDMTVASAMCGLDEATHTGDRHVCTHKQAEQDCR